MATIKERSKRFTAIVRRKGYPPQSKTFQRRADAVSWSASIERDMERGTFRIAVEGASTIESFAALLTMYSAKISPTKRGVEKERSLIRHVQADRACRVLMGRRLPEVSGADIARVRDCWLAEGRAPATVMRKLALISHAFEMARKEWAQDVANPARAIRWPRVSNERARRVSDDELRRIIAATESAELPALVRLLAGTAMRRSEALLLTWDRVFLAERHVRLDLTKNGDVRRVPLAPAMVILLDALPRREDGRVFSLTPDSASHSFLRAARRARAVYENEARSMGQQTDDRLSGVRLHDLRREAASRAIESGHFSIAEVAKIGGWRSINVLHNRYSHLHLAPLADKLAAAEEARNAQTAMAWSSRAPEIAGHEMLARPAVATAIALVAGTY